VNETGPKATLKTHLRSDIYDRLAQVAAQRQRSPAYVARRAIEKGLPLLAQGDTQEVADRAYQEEGFDDCEDIFAGVGDDLGDQVAFLGDLLDAPLLYPPPSNIPWLDRALGYRVSVELLNGEAMYGQLIAHDADTIELQPERLSITYIVFKRTIASIGKDIRE